MDVSTTMPLPSGPANRRRPLRMVAMLTLGAATLLVVSGVDAQQSTKSGRSNARARVAERTAVRPPPSATERRCGTGFLGGLFNPCPRPPAGLRGPNNAARELSRLGTAGRPGDRTARGGDYVSAYADPGERRSQRRAEKRPKAAGRALAALPGLGAGGTSMLYCVRLADGYLFPAPNSQFVQAQAYAESLNRCRAICADDAMDVFEVDRRTLDTDAMQSLTTGASYRDTANAFRYRDGSGFAACDFAAFHRRVLDIRFADALPADVARGSVPVPMARPGFAPAAPLAAHTALGVPIRVVYRADFFADAALRGASGGS